MEDIPYTNVQRKTDLKHMSAGGAIVAAIMILTPVKQWFFTREEGTALQQSIVEIKQLIVAESRESTRIMERKTDKILERMKETEVHVQHDVDRDNDTQNERLQLLEATILKVNKRPTN